MIKKEQQGSTHQGGNGDPSAGEGGVAPVEQPSGTSASGIALLAPPPPDMAVRDWFAEKIQSIRVAGGTLEGGAAALPSAPLIDVDPIGRMQVADGTTWRAARQLSRCTMAVATQHLPGGSSAPAPSLSLPLRQFFVSMARFGLRRGLLALLPGSDPKLNGGGVSASQWSAFLEEFEVLGRELAFDTVDVLPLDYDDAGRLHTAAWFNDSSVTAMLEASLVPPVSSHAGAGRPLGASEGDATGAPKIALRLQVLASDASGPSPSVRVTPHHLHLPGGIDGGIDLIALPSARNATAKGMRVEPSGEIYLQLDRAVALKAGEVLAKTDERPEVADQMAVHLIWGSTKPMLPGRPYKAALNGQQSTAQISTLKHKINVENLDHIAASKLEEGEIGYCNLSLGAPFVFDPYETCRSYGLIEISDPETGEELGLALISHALRRATNVHWQALDVDRSARAALKGQQPCCLWFTGLSGSGKSTVASLLEKRLQSMGRHTYTLDGDNVRHGLNRDLGFTDVDRVENIRRIGEVSKLMVDAGLIVMCSFISPFRAERRMARDLFDSGEFIEVFVDTPLEICEARDIKGLYKKARAGSLKNFTGIDSPYEPPENAELRLAAGADDPESMVDLVLAELQHRGIV